MTGPGASIFAAFWLLSAIFAAVGMGLLWIGIWPRRRGAEPRCRGCGYNLTGIESERCPECGRVLGANAIVHGTRRRRPWRIGIGVLLLLLAGGATVPNLVQIDWYAHKPAGWVLSDLNNPATFDRAWRELQRRYGAGKLRDRHVRKLVAFALAEQGQPWGAGIRSSVVDVLGTCHRAGDLTAAEEQQFLSQATCQKLEVRSPVVVGDAIPLYVWHDTRLPGADYWVQMATRENYVDGTPQGARNRGSSYAAGLGGGGGSGGRLDPRPAGRHLLRVDVLLRVYRGPLGDENAATLLLETTQPLEAPFEVLAEEPPDLLVPIRAPEMQVQLEQLLSVAKVECFSSGVGVEIHANAVPVSIAFDIYVRHAGGEQYIASIAEAASSGGHGWHTGGPQLDVCADAPTTCTVVLRSSARAAKTSIDVFKYWEGELVFEDVPVTPPR